MKKEIIITIAFALGVVWFIKNQKLRPPKNGDTPKVTDKLVKEGLVTDKNETIPNIVDEGMQQPSQNEPVSIAYQDKPIEPTLESEYKIQPTENDVIPSKVLMSDTAATIFTPDYARTLIKDLQENPIYKR